MSTAYHLRCWTRFLATVDQVWDQKTDPNRLADEFRPWLSLVTDDDAAARRLLSGEGLPGTIHARLRLGGVLPGTRWPLRLERLERGRRYVDSSENPLFAAWHHEHLFEPCSDGVRYVDAVTFTPRPGLPPGWVARATAALFVHRHRRAARHLPTDPRATGVVMLRELLRAPPPLVTAPPDG